MSDFTSKEKKLYECFAANEGKCIERTVLVKALGGMWSSNALDVHVKNLRKKLDLGSSIIAIRGQGYVYRR